MSAGRVEVDHATGPLHELGRAFRAAVGVRLEEWEEQGTGDVIVVVRTDELEHSRATLYRRKLEEAGRVGDALEYLGRFRDFAIDKALELTDQLLADAGVGDYLLCTVSDRTGTTSP